MKPANTKYRTPNYLYTTFRLRCTKEKMLRSDDCEGATMNTGDFNALSSRLPEPDIRAIHSLRELSPLSLSPFGEGGDATCCVCRPP